MQVLLDALLEVAAHVPDVALLVLSLLVLYRGHNLPGGGFVTTYADVTEHQDVAGRIM